MPTDLRAAGKADKFTLRCAATFDHSPGWQPSTLSQSAQQIAQMHCSLACDCQPVRGLHLTRGARHDQPIMPVRPIRGNLQGKMILARNAHFRPSRKPCLKEQTGRVRDTGIVDLDLMAYAFVGQKRFWGGDAQAVVASALALIPTYCCRRRPLRPTPIPPRFQPPLQK
jgi:hypothetical protein